MKSVKTTSTRRGFMPSVRAKEAGGWAYIPLRVYFPTAEQAVAYGEKYLKGRATYGSTDT